MTEQFKALGKKVRRPSKKSLETFAKPADVTRVTMESEEVTSLCPVTGQPDWDKVSIHYSPNKLCLESKSLKLYLWSFRQKGTFCENLANSILGDLLDVLDPLDCTVVVEQRPRGGVKIVATAHYWEGDRDAR